MGQHAVVLHGDVASHIQGTVEGQGAVVHRQVRDRKRSVDRQLGVNQHQILFERVAAAQSDNCATLHINRVVVAARNCCCVAGAYATVVDYHVGFGLGIILQVDRAGPAVVARITAISALAAGCDEVAHRQAVSVVVDRDSTATATCIITAIGSHTATGCHTAAAAQTAYVQHDAATAAAAGCTGVPTVGQYAPVQHEGTGCDLDKAATIAAGPATAIAATTAAQLGRLLETAVRGIDSGTRPA
ncbi:MAG: hypothetical protein WC560_13165 [Syntrophales bacterium]